MKSSLCKLIVSLVVLVLVAPCSVVRAGWYGENVERGRTSSPWKCVIPTGRPLWTFPAGTWSCFPRAGAFMAA